MKNETHSEYFEPDDPQLTAYALGELEGDERVAIEARLAVDPAARAMVAAVRAMAGEMTAALAAESALESDAAAESARLAANVNGRTLKKLESAALSSRGQLIRFPQFYYVISGLAAACFVVFVLTRPPEVPRPKPKHYTEMAVGPVALPVAEAETETAAQASPMAADPFGPLANSIAMSADTKLSLSLLGDNPQSMIFIRDSGTEIVRASRAVRSEPVGRIAAQNVAFNPTSGQPFQKLRPEISEFTVMGGDRLVSSIRSFNSAGSPTSESIFGSSASPALLPKRGGLVGNFGWKSVSPVGEVRATPLLISRLTADLHRVARAETYAYVRDNDFFSAAQAPLSTFSLDVDTASYANVRRYLKNGMRPPSEAVRIEELINYFPYRSASPKGDAPITASLEVAGAPWADGHRLVRIFLNSRELTLAPRAPANLIFLIDVSASMAPANRLPLVKESLRLLLGQLRTDDRVAIVTYAGNSGLALPSTPAARTKEIVTALDNLTAGGATNGELGIQLAYDIAKANFVTGGVNRVILCTDGDFNVGVTNSDELTRLVAEKAKTGVFLTTLGFGMGNFKDAMLEKLADSGNGNYGYIDTRREAEKLLVEQVNGTLVTVAKDVKIQVDFNAARVASYRLIGYENRLLKKEDFNDDNVDAGEMGAGHSVTALYEIVPAGAENRGAAQVRPVDESKYTAVRAQPAAGVAASAELLTVRVRYKEPGEEVSRKLEFPLTDTGAAFVDATPDFKFAAAVASFGMILRNSPHKGNATLDQVAAWAAAGIIDDAGGWRSEFIELARIAKTL